MNGTGGRGGPIDHTHAREPRRAGAQDYAPPTGPGSDSDGESPAQFSANLGRILTAVEHEPESTAADLATDLDLHPDAVARALLYLVGAGRLRVTTGRHHVPSYAIPRPSPIPRLPIKL